MAVETLTAILILLPVGTAVGSLLIRSDTLRKPWTFLSALVLIIASLLLLPQLHAQAVISFSPSKIWDNIILVLDFILMAYFLYVGIVHRHLLIILLMAIQWILFPLFKFGWLPENFEVAPTLLIDPLALIMCLVITIVGSLIVIYALDYMREHEAHLKLARTRQPVFFFFLVLFLGAMNGLVFANNLLWLFFFWEVTTLCCYQLIRHDLTSEAVEAALRALWMNLVGAVACILGMMVAFRSAGTLSIHDLIGSGVVGPAVLVPLALFCLTGFTKAAQVPFQSWLLGAMVAPTPVSALLHSSTMVKAGVYLVLRLAPGYAGTPLSVAVAIFGAFVFMVTALIAISQTSAKRVLAYSTISNLGLIICCAGLNTSLAIAAALILIIFHAISKGLMFLVVGIVEQHIASRNIEDMEGLVARLPVIAAVAVLGMLTMAFLPFGVVLAKWAGLEAAALPVSKWFLLVVTFMAIGSAASLVFWTKWMGRFLSHVDTVPRSASQEVKPFYSYSTVLLLLAGAVVLSFFVVPLAANLIAPAAEAMGYLPAFTTAGWVLKSTWGSFPVWPVFVALIIALLIPAALFRVEKKQLRAAYLCGENVTDAALSFRSVADLPVTADTGGMYWDKVFGERSLTAWVNWGGIILLVVLFLGVIV